MIKRFIVSWVVIYTFNSFSGYLIHHVMLGATYQRLMPALHSEDIKSKIWAFVISGLTGSFFFTLIYSRWTKKGTIPEGLVYGFFIGAWMGINMALNTYASTGLIPISLAMQWLLYSIIQYSLSGILLGFIYNLSFFNNSALFPKPK